MLTRPMARILTTLAIVLIPQNSLAALCSRILTFTDGSVLTAAQLNSEFNNAIDCLNSISNANISSTAAISPSKISASIAGDGIARDGGSGVLSVGVDGSTIEINSDLLRVKALGITSNELQSDASIDANRAVTTNSVRDAAITLAKLAATVQAALIPIGGIMPYSGSSAPTGFLLCDGSAVSRTTYAALFAVIGITHGQGDASTTFNIPDYRGRFLRGIDGTAGRDPDKLTRTAMTTGGNSGNNVGSVQLDALKSHDHNIRIGSASATFGAATSVNGWLNTTGSTSSSPMGTYPTANPIVLSGGSETRPLNAYVNYLVKY